MEKARETWHLSLSYIHLTLHLINSFLSLQLHKRLVILLFHDHSCVMIITHCLDILFASSSGKEIASYLPVFPWPWVPPLHTCVCMCVHAHAPSSVRTGQYVAVTTPTPHSCPSFCSFNSKCFLLFTLLVHTGQQGVLCMS